MTYEKDEAVQVQNSAGGLVFQVDNWTRLDRFLIMGSEGGSYYASQRALTIDNIKSLYACIKEDGNRVLDTILTISESGRAVKNDPAILALAVLLKKSPSVEVRRAAAEAVPKVCRTFTHLTTFAEAIKAMGGWGKLTRLAFTNWYNTLSENDLSYQMVKYQNRNGWSHRDILLKAHVKPTSDIKDALYQWAAKGPEGLTLESDPALQRVGAFESAKVATSEAQIVELIGDFNLPRECVPTQFLNDIQVWEALLQKMPLTAMIRNLGKMTQIGLLSEGSAAAELVVSRLQDSEYLRRARVHPMTVLTALRTYTSGQGVRGSLTWKPVKSVSNALDSAFYAAFDFVEPTGKRFCLALDVSGSMGWGSTGILTPREVSAAMAMTVMRTEENYEVLGFQNALVPINLTPSMSLDAVVKKISNLPFGSTNCALPMQWAKQQKKDFDAFVIYTDNETHTGWGDSPAVALKQYRAAQGIEARLAVVGVTSTPFTIADPKDAGMMDIAGFDTSVPTILSAFVSGDL